MRELINILETSDGQLKQQVISLVKQTTDPDLLHKVLVALKATDLGNKLKSVLKQDADASKIIERLANLIIHVDGTAQEKEKFADDYAQGFINTGKLMDGQQHTLDEIVSPGFPTRVFMLLATELTAQGVGPGELALAIMSPNISHSGRKSGGGDLTINDKAVEVKTTVSRGGRWSDARKADLDMQSIKKELTKALEGSGIELPPRLGIGAWLTKIKPYLETKPGVLDQVVDVMAKGLFSHVDVTNYKHALKGDDAEAIVDAVLSTGYENYKKYSGFEGLLMIDVRGEGNVQFFNDYEEMKGHVKPSTIYLYAPESEAMPQVELIPSIGSRAKQPKGGGASAPVLPGVDVAAKAAELGKPMTGLRPKGAETRDKREPSTEPRQKR